MATKNADTEPASAETGKSKVQLVVDLLQEWQTASKDTGSNQALLAELESRYPDKGFKMPDVTNGKAAAKRQGGTPKKRTGKAKSTKPTAAATEPSLSDIRAVARLASELGGIGKVSAAIEAIKEINEAK